MQLSTKRLETKLARLLTSADILLVLTAVPVLVLFALAPGTFELSWAGFGKLGRGGLFFVLFFLAFELWEFRKIAKPRLDRFHKAVALACLSLGLLYFGGVGLEGWLTNFVYSVGKILGASGEVSNSWLMATDYMVMTLYLTALTAALFSVGSIRSIITPIVFSAGMLIFYALDAFFPYGSLGPLQFWANFIVVGVALLSGVLGLPIYGVSNNLTIVGTKGFFRLVVYWPSVGVQSMLIYSLVMVLLAAKLDSPIKRKLIYVSIGVLGTVFLNVFRIFIIAYYGYAYATTGQELDAFHNSIGEILFPIWIIIFLVIVLQIEGRIMRKGKEHAIQHSQQAASSSWSDLNPRRIAR